MISITVQEFKTHCPRASTDWITTKCVPVKTMLAHNGIQNVYDAERVLKTARRIFDETQKNKNLANSRKERAIKNLEHIIARIERYIEKKSQRLQENPYASETIKMCNQQPA